MTSEQVHQEQLDRVERQTFACQEKDQLPVNAAGQQRGDVPRQRCEVALPPGPPPCGTKA